MSEFSDRLRDLERIKSKVADEYWTVEMPRETHHPAAFWWERRRCRVLWHPDSGTQVQLIGSPRDLDTWIELTEALRFLLGVLKTLERAT